MAEGKKTFMLYTSYLNMIEELNTSERGEVFTWLLEYVNDLSPELPNDRLLRTICKEIKGDLKRDLEKWEAKCLKNSDNAKKRWHPTASDRTIRNANHADKDKDKDKDKEVYRAFAHLSISLSEKDKLSSKYTTSQIDSILDEIENYQGNKKYKSLYLTAQKWLGRNENAPGIKTTSLKVV